MVTKTTSTSSARIVHLTSVHPALDVRIFHKECKTLQEAGYDVVLIAPHQQDENIDGIRIRAVPKFENRKDRVTRTTRAVLRAALEEDADLYHFHDPELIPVGMWLRLRGKRVIYDVHENIPRQILSKPWIPAWLKRPLSAGASVVEGAGARLFDGISAATPTIANRFPVKITETIQNFPILKEFDRYRAPPYRERPAIAAYVGAISVHRGAREMLEAVERLPQEMGVRLNLAGVFQPVKLMEELQSTPGWSIVEYSGHLRRAEVVHLLGRARVGLVTLHPLVNYLDAFPIKLFEYMAAGIPVVASDFPLWREIVSAAGCGLLVDPLDAEAIGSAVQWLIEHEDEAEAMGRRGQKAARENYRWKTEGEKLIALYNRLLGENVV